MKKNIAVLALLFLAVFSILVMTQETVLAEGVAPQNTAASIKQITGGIVAGGGQSAGALTVKQGKKEVVIYVSDATKITFGSETKAIADLTEGKEVSVRYIEENGQNTAKSIVIIGAQ